MFSYSDYCQRRQAMLNKSAVAVLTPEAMQAAMQPPPADPAAMGGAPMDPNAMGGMMPPGGAPMPSQGAPMDPGMAGGMPPMGAPAGGLPPEAMQDQLFLQFLAEAFGIMLDPRSGQFFDQNGQPVPPEMLMQAYQAYMSGMQQLQMQGGDPNAMGGAPMDPAMMGGQPPMDPAMAGGMPPAVDPAAMGAAPMDPGMMPPDAQAAPAPQEGGEQGMDPMMQELADLMVAVMEDTIVAPMKEELAAIQKQFADLKELLKTVRDDMGTIRTDVDAQESRAEENDVLRSEIAAELEPTVEQPEEEPQEKQATLRPLNILDILGGK